MGRKENWRETDKDTKNRLNFCLKRKKVPRIILEFLNIIIILKREKNQGHESDARHLRKLIDGTNNWFQLIEDLLV